MEAMDEWTRLSLTSQPAWRSNSAILRAVAAILPDQLDDVGRQPCLVVSTVRDLALRRAMLIECRAGTALGNQQRSSNMLDADAASFLGMPPTRSACELSDATRHQTGGQSACPRSA